MNNRSKRIASQLPNGYDKDMIKLKPNLLCLYQADHPDETHFFQQVAQHFDDLFQIVVLEKTKEVSWSDYQGILSLTNQPYPLPVCSLADFHLETIWEDPLALLALQKKLLHFYSTIQYSPLDDLPFHFSYCDLKGRVLYDNLKSDTGFAAFGSEAQDIEDWLIADLEQSSTHTLHFQIPNDSFDQILMQTYEMLYDAKGAPRGILQQVQDIRPLLNSYLENSGQAIVGWSDVTSGASIKNNLLDD